MLVSIEGPDFVGKNTVIDEIVTQAPTLLPKLATRVISFPNNDTEIGRICRQMLKTNDWPKARAVIFQLLNTAHRYEYYEILKKAKDSMSEILFVVRYNLSGPVYASIDGLDATKTWQLYDWFDDALPDMTFILFRTFDMKALSHSRVPEHYETASKQTKVRELYLVAPILWGSKLGRVQMVENKEVAKTVHEILHAIKSELKI